MVVTFIVPLVSKGKDYWDHKKAQVKMLGETAKKAIRYNQGEGK